MEALRVISCCEAIALCGTDLDAPKAMRTTFSRYLPIGWLSKNGLYIFQVNISQEYGGYERHIVFLTDENNTGFEADYNATVFPHQWYFSREKRRANVIQMQYLYFIPTFFECLSISYYLNFLRVKDMYFSNNIILYYYNTIRLSTDIKED